MPISGDMREEALSSQTGTTDTAPGATIGGGDAPGPKVIGDDKIPVMSIISGLGVMASLNDNIERYLKEIKEFAGSDNPLGNVEIFRLQSPNGAHAVIAKGYAFIFMFSDMLQNSFTNFTPLSDYEDMAVKILRKGRPDIKILNTILVTPDMYTRSRKMAHHVLSSIAVRALPQYQQFGVSELTTNSVYVTETDPNAVRNFIEAFSPHGVPARSNLNILVGLRQPRNNISNQFVPDETTPIFAISAFVDMLRLPDVTTGTFKYLPNVRITDIVSPLAMDAIVPLALSVAGSHLIGNNGWRAQFGLGRAKGTLNLGSLVAEADGKKQWAASSIEEMNVFISQQCFRPVLSLDITEGRARLPHLGSYGTSSGEASVRAAISAFFKHAVPTDFGALYDPSTVEFIGTIGDAANGSLRDSRNVDYLQLASEQGALSQEVEGLLNTYSNDPAGRTRLIANLTGNYQSLYRNTTSVLNHRFLAFLNQVVQSSGLDIRSSQAANPMSLHGFALAQANWGQQNAIQPIFTQAPGGMGGWQGNLYQV